METVPGDEARVVLAKRAVGSLPHAAADVLPVRQLMGERNGHVLGRGFHIGWLWGEKSGRLFLEILVEHRMSGSVLNRLWCNGEIESLPGPSTMRMASRDPVEDALLEAEFIAKQRQLVDDLRARGLLMPLGMGVVSLEINELLATARLSEEDAAD